MNHRLFAAVIALFALPVASSAEDVKPVIKVAPGFAVERIYSVPRETHGSWISLCSDQRGMLYASDQLGPIYRIEIAGSTGGEVIVGPVKLPIGGVHGMAFVGEALYAVVGQKEVCQPGLYRLQDADGNGELDRVEPLKRLNGEGEHGPHAVVASPDGQSLYVMAGNATELPELAGSRVPKSIGSDSLPRLRAVMGSETRGLPHGGWICRTDLHGREWELFCMGFRNAYALAFDARGELFTADSDTEFEFGFPWYRPNRVLQCVSGGDFGWRSGALKVPEHAPEAAPAVVGLGAGSPTAVVFGGGTGFPDRYRDALFVGDWTFGRLLAVHFQPVGAGFTATTEEIVTGTPLPITAACIRPTDGALYFVVGGRQSESALYRLSWKGPDR